MEPLSFIFDFILHIDVHLGGIIAQYGVASYAILFVILFAETGFVFTPFLPGDSLLFAAGIFAAVGSFNIILLLALFWVAAFLGDTVNYGLGHFFGKKLIANPNIPINQKHLEKTREFYEKHGGKTIILARFVPIIRTFAPFVAGMGAMPYKKFMQYNAAGGFVWVSAFTLLGYFFGAIPSIRENLSVVLAVIILLSVVPVATEFIKAKLRK